MTLFNDFMDMLKRLGIDPQPTDRDPYGTMGGQRVMTMLEQVRDFPTDRLPEIESYAQEVEALNPEALIKKMRQVQAQKPKKQEGWDISDEAIERYERAKWERHKDWEGWPVPIQHRAEYDRLKERYGC